MSRLAHQVGMYDHCFAERVLATTPHHLEAARQSLHETWGVIVLDPVSHDVMELRRPHQPQEHDLAAQRLSVEELHVPELNSLLHDLGMTRTATMNNDWRQSLLHTHDDAATLHELTFRTLTTCKGGRVYVTQVGMS